MPEHFITLQDAESDLLSCATYLAERINSVEGHAEAIAAVVPRYLAKGNVDLSAELANTVDDPYTRDRLLIAVAEKCAELDDDEYALQLAEAVEEPGLQAQAFERIGLQKAAKGEFEKAREIASGMVHPDGVLVGIAVKENSLGLGDEALRTIEAIEHSGAAVTALVDIAVEHLRSEDAENAVKYLERAVEKASDIEHTEERARAYCDIGNGFTDAGRFDRAIETFDKAKATAETLDNMHRDAFLSLAAQGFLHAGSVDLADRTLDLVADKTHIASALFGFSREFWRKDERDDAIESLEEAYAILESQHERETRDHKARFRLFTSIAAQFAGFEKGERAIEIAEGIKDEGGQRTSALSQIAAVLTMRKEDEQARHAFRAIDDDGDRVFALIGMSDAKEKNEERAAAIDLLSEAATLAETVPQLRLRSSAYGELAKRYGKFEDEANCDLAIKNCLDALVALKDPSSKVAELASLSALIHELGLGVPESERETLRSILVSGV
jgi:tetratricopeptide (TPR) repeat protein